MKRVSNTRCRRRLTILNKLNIKYSCRVVIGQPYQKSWLSIFFYDSCNAIHFKQDHFSAKNDNNAEEKHIVYYGHFRNMWTSYTLKGWKITNISNNIQHFWPNYKNLLCNEAEEQIGLVSFTSDQQKEGDSVQITSKNLVF